MFYDLLWMPEFLKTSGLKITAERQVLSALKFFLAGYHGDVEPEKVMNIRVGDKKRPRLDFVIDGVAIEVAVQPRNGAANRLYKSQNASEIQKCIKYKKRAMLFLLDLRKKRSLSKARLDSYRTPVSVGKGNHKLTAFALEYIFHENGLSRCESRVVRVVSQEGEIHFPQ